MRSAKFAFVLAVLIGGLTACTSTPEKPVASASPTAPVAAAPTSAPLDELAAAKQMYGMVCVRCHKADGTGGVLDMDGDKLNVPDLHKRSASFSDAKLTEKIKLGGNGMTRFDKRLNDEQIAGLVKYVRTEFHGQK